MGRKRKGLSKRARFEVFKRDGFTCQYCGRTPPQVILEADHMIPVAQGGEDHESNMVTACQDCNRGKADKVLGQVPAALDVQMADRRDRASQVVEYNRFLLEIRERQIREATELGTYWCDKTLPAGKQGKYTFGEPRMASVRQFLKHLPAAEIMDSIDIAFARVRPTGDGEERTFRYFCGVCWKKIKDN